jgi:hypothetical protein
MMGRPGFRVGPRRDHDTVVIEFRNTPPTLGAVGPGAPTVGGMNIDDALDTPASEAQPTNWVKSFLIPLLVATVAGSVSLAVGARVFQSGDRSTQLKIEADRSESVRQAMLADKLTLAYNAFSTITPAGSTIGSLTTAEKQQLEYAMRDVYLYGDTSVTTAVDKWFKSNFKSPVEGVLLPLRNQIRTLTGLAPSKQTSSPWIQTYWRTDEAPVPTTTG